MIEDGLSNVAYFRTDGGSPKLYTQEYVDKKDKEIERLNNIIDNAIKGIEDFYYGDEEYKKYDYTLAYKIYHILKGSDKD